MTLSTVHTSVPDRPSASTAWRRVTDAPTRMFHGLFALSFVLAYLTAESEHWRLLHVTCGYCFAGLLVFRLVYGLLGPRQSRLSALFNRLRAAPDWLRSARDAPSLGAIPWRAGQNLAMALALVALLVLAIPLTLSGHATYNAWDLALGGDVFEELHEFFGEAYLLVVVAHLGLIATLSLLRRTPLALSMLTGRLPGTGPSPVRHNRAGLAIVLLVAVLVFGVSAVVGRWV